MRDGNGSSHIAAGGIRRRGGIVDLWVLLIAGMVAAIFALGVFTWGKYQALKELEETGITGAIEDLKIVAKMSPRIAGLAESARVFDAQGHAADSLLSFFSEQFGVAGIKRDSVKGVQALPKPQPRDGYVELGFKLHLQGITRDQLTKFLYQVEDSKPFIKSKIISMSLDEYHNIVETFVTLVYYEREK